MPDLEPLAQYYDIEVWEYESGRCGWSIKSLSGRAIDKGYLGSLVLELGEDLIGGDHEVLASLFFRDDGSVTTRKTKDIDFKGLKNYVWVKTRLYQSAHYLVYRDAEIKVSKLLRGLWTVQWYWHRFRGRFKASQTKAAAAATHVAPTPVDVVSEQSEASEQGSAPNVLPFRKHGKQHDIRPL